MKNFAVAFLAGLVFAVGLAVAGMTQPAKVLAFLDVFGAWDPSLALVMIGAIGVYLPAYRLIRRRRAPVLDAQFAATEDRRIDTALVGGAALFGIGWGIAGFCPGPAVVSIATATPAALVFAAAMIGGTALCQLLVGRRSERVVGCGESGTVSSSTR